MGCECARENDRPIENGTSAFPPLNTREEVLDCAYRPCRPKAFEPESCDSASSGTANNNCDKPRTDSSAAVEEQQRYNLEQLREWYRNREFWRIGVWMNAPANAGTVAQMDRDIDMLKHYAPDSPALALLLQLRGLRAQQLESRQSA